MIMKKMKKMRIRFVPKHYWRNLFDNLENLKQGSFSIKEYYKEIEKAMCRVHKPKVPNWPASQQKLSPADGIATMRASWADPDT